MGVLLFFLFWIFLSIIAGIIASNKNRSGIGYFFLALIFSPLIGIVVALVVSDKSVQPVADDIKKCMFCAEDIKKDASICKHCGKEQIKVLPSTISIT